MGTAARSAAAALLLLSAVAACTPRQQQRAEARREYGRRRTGIKAKYRLTVTPPEKQALQELPATCPA
ncbi:hypothetical protein ACIHCV_12260 [Streptomyces sp. NPDC051956]|uniref:hypothetical protein n=1 Tax=Streptomyces sp. NPDC051956 TaxID=3365677 RepID=UPI0037D8AF61